MKKTLLFLSIFFVIIATLLSACQSRIVGDSITGDVVGAIAYGEVTLERQGNKLVPVKEFQMVDYEDYKKGRIKVLTELKALADNYFPQNENKINDLISYVRMRKSKKNFLQSTLVLVDLCLIVT